MTDRARVAGTLAELGRCPHCSLYLVFLRQPFGRALPYDVEIDPLADRYTITRDAHGKPTPHLFTCTRAAVWHGVLRDDPMNAGVTEVELGDRPSD